MKKWLLCLLTIISSIGLSACDALNGKNGTNGKDVTMDIKEDGYIYIDGEKTEYYFINKDCTVSIDVKNPEYGKVYGEGKYAYGTALCLKAEPNENGIFVAWKDCDGKVISTEKECLIVVDHNENRYQAEFACNPKQVKANIHVKFDKDTLPNATYIGDNKVILTDGVTLKFDHYEEKTLVLYTLSKEYFTKDYQEINAHIASNELGIGKVISYEEMISLYDGITTYDKSNTDFYFYVSGKTNQKYSVSISSSNANGSVQYADGSDASHSQDYLGGTVLKLKAVSKSETINGQLFETSEFLGWEIDDEIISKEKELEYKVWDNVNIVAKFKSKVKLNLVIESGEEGLTGSRYPDLKDPSKATGKMNQVSFETNLTYTDNTAKVELGYYHPNDIFALEFKLHSELRYAQSACKAEDSWKYITLSYEYQNVKIGGGNSLLFFIPSSSTDEVNIHVKYVRTTNYYSSATDETGENSKEYLYESGYGLGD